MSTRPRSRMSRSTSPDSHARQSLLAGRDGARLEAGGAQALGDERGDAFLVLGDEDVRHRYSTSSDHGSGFAVDEIDGRQVQHEDDAGPDVSRWMLDEHPPAVGVCDRGDDRQAQTGAVRECGRPPAVEPFEDAVGLVGRARRVPRRAPTAAAGRPRPRCPGARWSPGAEYRCAFASSCNQACVMRCASSCTVTSARATTTQRRSPSPRAFSCTSSVSRPTSVGA